MAFTQIATMLCIDTAETNFYTQPVSLAGANGVNVGLTILAPAGASGTALLRAWPQTSNDLENWADFGGSSGGSATPLFNPGPAISSPISLQGAVGPNADASAPYNKAIPSTWLRFAFRIPTTGFGKTNVAMNINTFSG